MIRMQNVTTSFITVIFQVLVFIALVLFTSLGLLLSLVLAFFVSLLMLVLFLIFQGGSKRGAYGLKATTRR